MDGDELENVNSMDLDLNHEPGDPFVRYGSLLNNIDTSHDRIEERIRQLEAVNARARQRQRWRQTRNSIENSYIPSEATADESGRGETNNVGVGGITAETGKGYKRDSSHLVARALMDSEVKNVDKDGGSFYDCNICLDMAMEPILTCCGHLFCWPCFYQVSYIDVATKECPVCKGEVSDNTVVPIYGNVNREPVSVTESGLVIPPRPKARRIEGVRQCRVTQGLSHVPVAEALRRIRISIDSMDGQVQQLENGGGSLNSDSTQAGQNSEEVGGRRTRIHQVSRVLSESAASLDSLSSALSNAERLVEDLETVINNRLLQGDAGALPVTGSNNPAPDTAGLVASSFWLPVAPSSSLRRRSIMARVSDLENQVSREASSSSARRRSLMSRISDLDSRDSREVRRRRLN